MGHAVGGEAATSAETSVADEIDETENEDESIVHHTASVGDAEVLNISYITIWSSMNIWTKSTNPYFAAWIDKVGVIWCIEKYILV